VSEDFEHRQASRRGFFREALAGLLAPVVELLQDRLSIRPDGHAHSERPPLRPPGAAAGAAFAELCDACGACAAACGVGAIVMDPLPRIVPAATPCRLCPDLPCIAACKTGALQPVRPEQASMGLAVWVPPDCLLSSGESCEACAEACPVEGAIGIDGNELTVNGALCTGCGACEHHCPARPRGVVIEAF
jgi:ferredoxin-type protein NapG